MSLTAAQLTTLKADILANSDLNVHPDTPDGNTAIAALYNAAASPAYTVWKKLVTITEVGDNIDGTDLAGLSSLNASRLQTVVILSAGGVNPSLPDRREFFDDIFSGAGGATTRANLLVLWKRLATRAEKLFATGTGSDASPAISAFADGFLLTFQDVELARNLP